MFVFRAQFIGKLKEVQYPDWGILATTNSKKKEHLFYTNALYEYTVYYSLTKVVILLLIGYIGINIRAYYG